VFRRASYILIAFLLIAGCQGYRKAPIDLAGYDNSWLIRNVSPTEISKFTKELSAADEKGPLVFDPSDGLSLKEAEKVALLFNPEIRSARLKARIPLSVAAEAGRWEDPELEIMAGRLLEDVEETKRFSGQLSFQIPASGRLGAKKAKALSEYSAEELGVRAGEWALVIGLREKWLDWSISQEKIKAAQKFIAQIDKIILIADRLKEAGELSRIDSRMFEIEHAVRTIELESLLSSTRERKLEIKSLMGLAPAAEVRLNSSLSIMIAPLTPSERKAMLVKNNLKLARKRADYEVAENVFRLESHKQYPDINIGIEYEREGEEDSVLIGPSFRIPIWNINRAGVVEASATRAAARAELEALYERLTGELARAEILLHRAAAERESLEHKVVPLVEKQVQEIRKLAELGELEALLFLEVITRAHETKIGILEARLGETKAKNHLNFLLGPPLETEPSQGKE